jgi:hypothetical protein
MGDTTTVALMSSGVPSNSLKARRKTRFEVFGFAYFPLKTNTSALPRPLVARRSNRRGNTLALSYSEASPNNLTSDDTYSTSIITVL